MKKINLILVLSLSFIAIQAAGMHQKALTNQQNSQTLCVQKRINNCINKFCGIKAPLICVKICHKTIKNECRYAGE
ncbi:MAG: hypothetical protein H0T84_15160 [Tatlockia sp.]|nr:hypothetical protein [Tatlockia sp.]